MLNRVKTVYKLYAAFFKYILANKMKIFHYFIIQEKI